MESNERLCRLCTKGTARKYVDFDDIDSDNMKYREKFKQLFNDLLLEDNNLSNIICTKCCEQMKNALDFKKQCISAINYWRKQLDLKKNMQESVIEFVKIESVSSELNVADESDNGHSHDFQDTNLASSVKIEFSSPDDMNDICNDSDITKEKAISSKPKTRKCAAEPDNGRSDDFQDSNSASSVKIEFSSSDNTIDNCRDSDITKEKALGSKPKTRKCVAAAATVKHTKKTNKLSSGPTKKNTKLFTSIIDPSTYEIDNKNKIFSCKTCSKHFTDRDTLRKHMLVHTGIKNYSCKFCDRKTFTKKALVSHMFVHTRESPHCCNVCLKKFATRSSLNKHMRFHTNDRSYMCDICGRKFVRMQNLQNHLLVHTNEYKFECKLCPKKFKTQGSLKSHTDIHNKRTFNCELCDIVFPSYSAYYSHKKLTHEGDKKFACHICDKEYPMKKLLNRHIKVHTSEMRVQCELCCQYFARRQVLKRHMRTHTGERPYNCEICGKTFKHTDNLAVHKRIHFGEPTYEFKCEICGKGFMKKYNLDSHIKRQHTN